MDPAKWKDILFQLSKLYGDLSSEQVIWFWIVLALCLLILAGVFIAILVWIIQFLNEWLAAGSGPYEKWKPIGMVRVLLAGGGVWLIVVASIYREQLTGWSVVLAAGVLLLIGLLWLFWLRLGPIKAFMALVANTAFGIPIIPLLVQFALVALVLIVCLLVLHVWFWKESRTIYVRSG